MKFEFFAATSGFCRKLMKVVGLGHVSGVARNGEVVEPQLRPFVRDGVGDLYSILGLGCALLRLLDIAGEADHQADLAGGERIDVFGGVELAHRTA